MDNPLRLTKQVVIPETNITQVLTQVYSYDNLQVVALLRYPVVRTHTVRFEQHSTSLHINFFSVYCIGLGFTEGSSLTWSSWIIFRIVVHLVSERRSLNTQVTGKKCDKLGLLYAYILFHLSHFHHILFLSRRIPPKKPGLLFIHSRIPHPVQLVKGCPISYIRTRNCFNINILPLTIETVKFSWLKLTLFISCCSYLHYCITYGNKYWSKSSRMEQNDSCCLSVHSKQLKTQILTPPAVTQCCIVKSKGLGIGSKQFNIDLAGEGEVFKLE